MNPENYSSMMAESMLRVPLIDFSPLSANPISDFEKLSTHGFLIKKNFFPPDLIDQVKEWTMSYYGANNVSDGRVQDAWSYASCVRSLAAHPMVLEPSIKHIQMRFTSIPGHSAGCVVSGWPLKMLMK